MTGRRRVLVTGAAGFLGSHVVEQLSRSGDYEVLATGRKPTPRTELLAALPGVSFASVDLQNGAELGELVAGCDAVVHLAATRHQASTQSSRTSFEVNVGASYDLLQAAATHRVSRFVYGSSHLVYGDFRDPAAPFFTEPDAIPRPGLGMYAAGKLAAEALAQAFAGADGAPYISLRLGTIYGPRANSDSNAGIMLSMLDALDRGERPQSPWTRDALHALIFVDDAARATIRAIDVPGCNLPVNVVGEPLAAAAIYETLVERYGGDPSQIEWLGTRARYQRVSTERMRAVLGMEASTSLADGIEALIAWHRAGRSDR